MLLSGKNGRTSCKAIFNWLGFHLRHFCGSDGPILTVSINWVSGNPHLPLKKWNERTEVFYSVSPESHTHKIAIFLWVCREVSLSRLSRSSFHESMSFFPLHYNSFLRISQNTAIPSNPEPWFQTILMPLSCMQNWFYMHLNGNPVAKVLPFHSLCLGSCGDSSSPGLWGDHWCTDQESTAYLHYSQSFPQLCAQNLWWMVCMTKHLHWRLLFIFVGE